MDNDQMVTGISRLVLMPGDVLVLRTRDHLSRKAYDELAAKLSEIVPPGVKTAIFEDGCELVVVTSRT
jgi:hypothetical protein